jgi:RHS repeat-associated protein
MSWLTALAFALATLSPHDALGQCTVPTAPAPTLSPDTVWLEDDPPPDASLGDVWNWDTTQKASGASSHTQPGSPGIHQHYFEVPPSSFLWVGPGDSLVTYVLLDPCDPPTELMFQFEVASDGWEHRVYWGEDFTGWGIPGTPSRHYMGPLPPTGQWVRLEIPASAIGVGSRYLAGMAFTLTDGHAWFDRTGKAGVCAIGNPQPGTLPNDTVWFDDALPEGSDPFMTWIWDTNQKVSGTASHTEGASPGAYEHLFYANGDQLFVADGDTIVQYVLLDPCETPREIMLQIATPGNWGHGAYWGENLVDRGVPDTQERVFMGSLPPAGTWARLEIPASVIGISNDSLAAMSFLVFDGKAWFDRTGKSSIGLPVLTTLSLNPGAVQGGATSLGTATISSPAPESGTTILLSSSDSNVATVPASITIASGQTSGNFTVTTLALAADSSAVISASYGGVTRTASLSVTAAPPALLTTLSVSPAAVFGGGTAQATLTISNPAPPGGKLINLSSSNPSIAYLPGQVAVAQGQTSAAVTISTAPVDVLSPVSITASADGIDRTVNLDVIGPILAGIALSPSTAVAGSVVTGTVSLTNPAPPSGSTVSLSSSDPAATVGASVSIAPGATMATFSIATHQVAGDTPVTITASRYGVNQTASLVVTPCTFGTAAPPASFPADVVWFDDGLPPGSAPTGMWIWDADQKAMGIKSHTEPPATGFTQHYFFADASQVLHPDATDKLVVYMLIDPCNPPREVLLQYYTDSWEHRAFWGEHLIYMGTLGTESLTSMGALPVAGHWARLEFPASLIGVGGQDIHGMAFTLYDGRAWFDRIGKINASGAAVLSALSLTPGSVASGATATGTVSLTGPAAAGGAEVSLSSSDTSVATVPASVTVPADATSATFTVSASSVATQSTATLTATHGSVSRTAILSVGPVSVTSLVLSPGVVEGGTPSSGIVTLSAPASAGGLPVTLASSNMSAASVPSSVSVSAGALQASFTIVTTAVASTTSVDISATAGGVTQTSALVLVPPGPALSSLVLDPTSVNGGSPSTGTVTLTSAAGAGGFAVGLSSDNGAATVPASVSIVQGATSATFPVTTTIVASSQTATITANAAGIVRNATLSVAARGTLAGTVIDYENQYRPLAGALISVSPTGATATSGADGTFSLLLPQGSYTVTVTCPNFIPYTVPGSFAVTANSTTNVGQVFLDSFVFAVTRNPVVGGNNASLFLRVYRGGSVAVVSSNPSLLSIPTSPVTPAPTWIIDAPTQIVTSTQSVDVTATISGVSKTVTVNLAPFAVTGLTLSPAEVAGGLPSSLSLSVNGLAPTGGVTVNFTSSDPTVATVLSSVSIPAGGSGGMMVNAITTIATTTVKTATITATCGSSSASAILTVAPLGLSQVTLEVSSAAAGRLVVGGVRLNGPAPSGGVSVNVSVTGDAGLEDMGDGYWYPSEAVFVTAGSSYSTFLLLPYWSSSSSIVTVNATLAGVTKTATLEVLPGVTSIGVSPATVKRGQSTTAGIGYGNGWPPMLTSFPVTLSSSDTSILTVPPVVNAIFPSPEYRNGLGHTFGLTVPATAGVGTITLTAVYLGVTRTTTITVAPSILTAVVLRPTVFPGGAATKGVVTLDSPAPLGGSTVALSSSNSSVASVPASVVVPAGALSVSFDISSSSVASQTPVTLLATYGPDTRTAIAQVMPPGLAYVSGTVLDARVYEIETPLPDVVAALTTDASNATTTAEDGTFVLYANPGLQTAVAMSHADFATATSAAFTPAASGTVDLGTTRLKHLLAGPISVTGKVVDAANVGVAGAAGSVEGYEGTFTSNASGNYSFAGPDLSRYRLTFSKSGYPTRTDDTILALGFGTNYSLEDFVLDTAARPQLASVSVSPTPIVGGAPVNVTIVLTGPAPASPPPGGAKVSLSFSNPAVSAAHGTASMSAGNIIQAFSVATNVVASPQSTVVTAFFGGIQHAVTLDVVPTGSTLASVSLTPSTVVGGGSVAGTLTLSAPAPAGGATVALSRTAGNLNLPTSVTIAQGSTTGTFQGTTTPVSAQQSVTVWATYGVSQSALLTINPVASAVLVGVAPGWVVPGDSTPVLYGSSIQAGSTVTFTGPVYTLTDTQNTLCTVDTTCPTSALAATVDSLGTYAAFAIPAGAAPGIYHLKAKSPSGISSLNNQWIAVEPAQKTLGPMAANQHAYATRIYPGQTVTGTLTGDVPLNGMSDYNLYYFVATAGTRLNVSMQRVDASTPWESPASLDPQVEVIAPDGFIYTNLQAYDDVPGTDLNASLSGAILPQTGLYIIAAETTRGSGQYRLTMSLSSVAPAAAGSRAIVLSGSGNTVPLNRTISANALMLDPRGYPVAGADVTFAVESSPDDTGALSFVGGATTQTSLQGVAVKSATITAAGKVRFRPSFTSGTFSSLTFRPDYGAESLLASSGDEVVVPLYRPVARRPFHILGIDGGGITLSDRPITRLEPERIATRRREGTENSTLSGRSALTKPATKGDGGVPTPKVEARPLPKPTAYARVALTITGCAADLSLFTAAGVTASEVYPPFTVTLTDLTPPTGGGAANRPIDFEGIRDHRIEKKVRVKIDIKDGLGATPTYPVLVELALGGPRHGTLILDPDGVGVSCDAASFLWHESGNSNEQFDYKLGTLALLAGVKKDSTGADKPVWDEAEVLAMRISTVDSGGIETQWENDWATHPEPGRPDHFACYELDGSACPDTFRFWSPYSIADSAGHQESPGEVIYSAYVLADVYANETYGYTNTSMTAPASNVTVQFFDQVPGVPFAIYGGEYGPYGFSTRWNNLPAWPSGSLSSTLRVDYPADPDGDWSAGSVTKPITYQFDTGTSRALIQSTTYDLVRPDRSKGVTDGKFPMFVRPGMLAANMPKTEAGDTRRLTLLTVSGNQTWADWWESIANVTYWNYAEPYSAGTRFWRTADGGSTFSFGATKSDPKLETTDNPAFRFTLIDSNGEPVIDGSAFRVHRCPRFDHENQGRSCGTLPVDSVNGVVDNFQVNSGDTRGYVGIELTRAPLATGLYYVKVESLGQNYRIRRQGQLVTSNDPPTGEWQGAFQIAIVDDPVADCACETCPEQCTASPNFIGTGTYQARATDLTLPTPGFPVQVSRRYLSNNKKSGLMGLGWTTSLESRIWFSTYIAASGLSAPAANVLLPGGEQFRFTINGLTGAFEPPNGRRDTLQRNPADLSFDFTVQRSRTVYHFDNNGRLTTMTDEFGNAVTITYDTAGKPQRVADQTGSGRYIDVSWRADGKIDYIQDSASPPRRVSYGYAADGTLTTVTDPANRVTHYGYTNGSYGPLLTQVSDNWNRTLTVVTYDGGDRTKSYTENLETYTYTYVDGATTTKTNSSGQTSTFTTAPNGQITNRTPPTGPGSGTAHTDYNPDGSVAGTTDEVGVRTTYTYDAAGRVATVTRDASGASPVRFDYAYDTRFPDKVTSVTPKTPSTAAFDPNWQGWRYDYFPEGTLNHVYRLKNDGVSVDTVSTFQYDAKGRVTSQTAAGGGVTDYVYSGANLSTVTHPSNNDLGTRPVTTYSNYDGVGRPRTITDPAGKDTTYTYDALGRVLTVTLPKPTPSFAQSFTTTYSYDNYDAASGLVFTHVTDPNGKLTKLGYDEHGRLLKSIDALNNVTTYGYTRDVLTSITDANDNVTTYHYDPLKRLDTTTFADGKTETYTYWADGLLKTKNDRMGQTLTYEYDAFKRLKTKTYPSSATIAYTYVGQKLTQVDDTSITPNETHTFGYDSSYRVSQNVQGPRGTLGYTYTADDRVDTLTFSGSPSVTTAHTYYPDGSLNTISWSPQSGSFKYTYTPRGQYQTVAFPNTQTRTYTYDDQGRLTSLANALGATNIATYAYGYDVDWATGLNTMLGQRVSLTADVPSQGFSGAQTKYSYDDLYQLVKAQYPNVAPFSGEVHQWSYDAIGNRLTNQINATIQSYTYEKIGSNPKNAQKLLSDGSNSYAYDFNGSQTSRTGFGFIYDPDNRLSSINGGTTASYTYDYQGRRSSKTVAGVTTTFLYDGLNLIRETTSGNNTEYVFGPSIDEPLALYASGAVSYLNADGLGSVVATNGPTGTVTHSSIFDAWGVAKSEAGTRVHSFTYTGREVGEAGLHFYRARSLQPGVGRFTQEDPLGFGGGINEYLYAGSAPVALLDPTGLVTTCKDPCDERVPKNKHYLDYIRRHLHDASLLGAELQVPTENILGLSAEESGGPGFTEDTNVVRLANNYFSLHGTPPKGFSIPPGTASGGFYRSLKDGYLNVFKNYLESGEEFVRRYRGLATGVQDPTGFATVLHNHGYGVENSIFVKQLRSIIADMAARLKCPQLEGVK